jgi:hypothetical protein
MIKKFVLIIFLIAPSISTFSQTSSTSNNITLLCRKWMIAKLVSSDGKTVIPPAKEVTYITYFKDGTMELIINGEKTKGKWQLDEKTMALNTIEIESDGSHQKDDPAKITTLTATNLVTAVHGEDESVTIYLIPAQ